MVWECTRDLQNSLIDTQQSLNTLKNPNDQDNYLFSGPNVIGVRVLEINILPSTLELYTGQNLLEWIKKDVSISFTLSQEELY